MATALGLIGYRQSHNLVENSRLRGEQVMAGLRRMMERHPLIGDVRGLGLMFGLEYVRRRSTREPFPPERGVSARVDRAAMRHGLVTYPCTGSLDGTLGGSRFTGIGLIIGAVWAMSVMAKDEPSVSFVPVRADADLDQ